MGGAVYFPDANGNMVKVGADNPLPALDAGAVQAADVSADAPVTWDAGTSTIGITQDTAGGVPILDGSGKVSASELPPLQHDVGQAASEAEMLALSVSAPAMCIRTDSSPAEVWMLSADPATDIGNWHNTGAFAAAAANPSAQVGLNPVNGTASTYMRSDGAPALDPSVLAVHRTSGDVQLALDGEELIWPNDISTGKLRLYNSTPGSNNTYYGFGIANQTLIYQVDGSGSAHTFQSVDDSDNAVVLFEISDDGAIVAHRDLHMSEQKVVNLGNPDSARDAVNLQTMQGSTVAAGGAMKMWPAIGSSDPTPAGAVDGDIILRRTS